MRTFTFDLIINKYEFIYKETVCSLLYQTNHIKTWPYSHQVSLQLSQKEKTR